MRTFQELTKEQQESAVNYALNSLIDPKSFEGNLTNYIASLEPQARQNAATALYGDDPEFRHDSNLGILPVVNGKNATPIMPIFDPSAIMASISA